MSVISSFRRDMDEIGNLQGDYAAQNDDGTYRLSRHVGKGLTLNAAFLSFYRAFW